MVAQSLAGRSDGRGEGHKGGAQGSSAQQIEF